MPDSPQGVPLEVWVGSFGPLKALVTKSHDATVTGAGVANGHDDYSVAEGQVDELLGEQQEAVCFVHSYARSHLLMRQPLVRNLLHLLQMRWRSSLLLSR
jgi:hypothetical protein